MSFQPEKPLIVQSDRSILLEVENPFFSEARQALNLFGELVKSPEYIHTYRITPLSLWNAAASGLSAQQVIDTLQAYSKYGVPPTLVKEIDEWMGRYGLLRLEQAENQLLLLCDDPLTLEEIIGFRQIQPHLDKRITPTSVLIKPDSRGLIKQELIKLGFPVDDRAGYLQGEHLAISLKSRTAKGASFALREYQIQAIDSFHAGGASSGGSGVLVLPCGAGKTVIGIGAIARLQTATLILTTNATSVKQWISELLDKTDIAPELIGEYSGQKKEVKPITVATYQILTHRRKTTDEYVHMPLFSKRDWGLIIYDEVHLLPAPVFRMTAGIQARRRLGLTATLVREDGCEEEVFSLIGPKRFDLPWKVLERNGWIAQAHCQEIRLPFEPRLRQQYSGATSQQKYRIAAENPRKLDVIKRLLNRHQDGRILIIGQYVEQLTQIAAELGVPCITGRMAERDRERLFQQFKNGEIHCLVVSKVANFAVDLPDANVAIQISGTFGSRQEEAQRLGRILRPKSQENEAYFYTLITRDTSEQEYARQRQIFLVEQGYRYEIIDLEQLS
ncbi:DNA repair helicase XPB [Brevibacillus fulvus]|uniref:DNA 3'-5' helicase n=1 Tax=Brevibacillus fulvus TaxID=1125967 RepID=A0A938Y226_9BACL|nr:DNA repair helicase XPB [Brevibacillus fulvus]MBM7590969.1 DNA excision repair protein ERCC-3 [Brevibacillus fulvus]